MTKYHSTEERRAACNRLTRIRRRKLRAKGKCIRCKKDSGGKMWCPDCAKKATQTKASKFSRLKGCAKQRKIDFSLTKEDFEVWHDQQKKECTYCLATEEYLAALDGDPKKKVLSVDRKNNGRGYHLDNICLACFRCNHGKCHFFTHDEWMRIGREMIAPRLDEYHRVGLTKV